MCSTSRPTTSRCRSCRSATRSSGWRRTSTCSPARRSIFAESFDTIGRDIATGAAHDGDGRAAGLREDAGADPREGAVAPAARRARSSAGRSRAGRRGRGRQLRRPARGPLTAARSRRLGRPAGVLEDPGGRRRAPAATPSRAARRCRSRVNRVLHGDRPADHRGLRPHRDLADPHREPAGGAPGRHRRPAGARRRAPDRAGRRDPRARRRT